MSVVNLVYHPNSQWDTPGMPTTRPRHQVTETTEVAHALDLAARRWPGEPRSKLLLRLVDAGGNALELERHDSVLAHRAAVAASSGRYSAAFGRDYLSELRTDWPS